MAKFKIPEKIVRPPEGYISRKRAAEILGVSGQRIKDYVRYGLIDSWRKDNNPKALLFVPEQQVRNMMSAKVEIEDNSRRIEEYKMQLDQTREELKMNIAQVQAEANKVLISWKRRERLCQALCTFADAVYTLDDRSNLSQRDKDVVRDIFMLVSTEDIQKKYDISIPQINYIFRRVLKTAISDIPGSIKKRIEELETDNANLREVIRMNKYFNTDIDVCLDWVDKTIDEFYERGLLTKLSWTSLKKNNIRTLGQIASMRRSEFKSMYKIGPKTVSDIEKIFSRYNIHWAYDRIPED